ncbi:MAG TPA: hypothetical protein VLX29_08890 [Nitrospirota bacterium]|nr:hypothetical protein [Nitrospirota bacterium]
MSRKRQSTFEDLADLSARLPWWAGVALAVISFLILHYFAGIKVSVGTGPGNFGNSISKQIWVSLALFGQLIVPGAFSLGAIVSAIRNRQGNTLFSNTSKNPSAVAPRCSVCNSVMVIRTVKRGSKLGSQFWGCPKYPNCRGTLPIKDA